MKSKTPIIEFQNISKYFNDFAIENLSLKIYENEFFSLLGASGCGKTTLLRMLAGFEQPSSGKIYLNGQDITHSPPYKRPLNTMFQSYALFPHMTVEKNIAFGLKQDRLKKKEIAQRTLEMLQLTDLEPLRKKYPHELSGGQCQRAALSRSLAKRPKVLLLDEPMAALDKNLREQTQLELVNIQETLGTTFFMVTHDQEEAMTVSTHIAIMDQGKIIQIDTPKALYEYPNCTFVAQFFGTTNIFPCDIIKIIKDHYTLLQSPFLEHPIYIPYNSSHYLEKSVFALIRPEKMNLSKIAFNPSYNFTEGIIFDIIYLGGISQYIIHIKNNKKIRIVMTNIDRSAEQEITWGDSVYISWEPHNIVILNS